MNHATWQTGLMVLHRRLDPAWKTERARKALLHAMRDLREALYSALIGVVFCRMEREDFFTPSHGALSHGKLPNGQALSQPSPE